MDLLDFAGENLYFEESLPESVESLIQIAGGLYTEGGAEQPLLKALELAPESLNVLVALYRFYYYQHRLADALGVAGNALAITAHRLNIPFDWKELARSHISQTKPDAIALLRFHLLSLKAKAFLQMRLGQLEEAKAILSKLLELDDNNRIGAKQLLELAESVTSRSGL